ncbi:hypothetical protein N9081_01835 [Akkermansiaceae bacterium]|nr:hypothetical protein [bacterium]MDB4445363.1 hypothetical protein [Akkermansiaceae bacterium]MDB4510659.1 hypothetical protein [Akkermansiaceae bacterium]MDB4791588.1 hypothetical protein [Akkermansiaceae bacterium]
MNKQRILERLTPPPENGVHAWTLSTARKCRNLGISRDPTEALIKAFEPLLRDGRDFKFNEVENAVNKAFSTDLKAEAPKASDLISRKQWDPLMTSQIHEQAAKTPEDWRAISLSDPDKLTPKEVLEVIMKPTPESLICVGYKNGEYGFKRITKEFQEYKNLEHYAYVIPAFMTARSGMTQSGKTSAGAKSNTGERLFNVVDLDDPPPEEHSSILWELSKHREPALVLRTGGKGLHGWFPITEDDANFWHAAVLLGADVRIHKNKSQLVRLPNGTRDNGERQEVLFINPKLKQQ